MSFSNDIHCLDTINIRGLKQQTTDLKGGRSDEFFAERLFLMIRGVGLLLHSSASVSFIFELR
jgi:hypothetical protein